MISCRSREQKEFVSGGAKIFSSHKQSQYLAYLLMSKDIKLTNEGWVKNDDEYCEEMTLLDQRINKLKATINWDKESSTGKEKVTSSVTPENANTPSSPSTSNPTVVVDQVANSGDTVPNADSSVNPENANTISSPSTSNQTVVVDQVANSDVVAPDADTESVETVAESETVQLSSGCKTGELNGTGLKAKQDESEWEIVDEFRN
ncbi:hypothetical protein JTE90_029071 [Oedothorax gibbosus]|uniref:Uncharacterized protein n=1 Tax=Oedothorax gibbosus TaxID=931172 RepID=A0AAV6UXS7_9ARAC|nr:hypothetical protein JTE90_029071 [Oedothorax gibbosus]